MKTTRFPALAAMAVLSSLTAACAGASDRYPSLSLRNFERIQGQFPVADSSLQTLRPAPLSVQQAAQVSKAVEDARARHSLFLAQAEYARSVVSAAAGSGPNDTPWSIALVEIADLDSRLGATTSLLADLDQLYADATLSFAERSEVETARSELIAIVAAEGRAISGLVDMLGSPAS